MIFDLKKNTSNKSLSLIKNKDVLVFKNGEIFHYEFHFEQDDNYQIKQIILDGLPNPKLDFLDYVKENSVDDILKFLKIIQQHNIENFLFYSIMALDDNSLILFKKDIFNLLDLKYIQTAFLDKYLYSKNISHQAIHLMAYYFYQYKTSHAPYPQDIDFGFLLSRKLFLSPNKTILKALCFEDVSTDEVLSAINSEFKIENSDFQKFQKSVKFKFEIYKNTSKIILFSLILAMFFSALIYSIHNYYYDPFSHLSQLQKVELYYLSINEIDPNNLNYLMRNDIGVNDLGTVSTLYISKKITSHYGDAKNIIKPDEWLNLDDVSKNMSDVFGITNLKIDLVEDNIFKAEYNFYFKDNNEIKSIDRIDIIEFDDYNKIIKIDRQEF